jgi:hypothetical protein
VSDIKIMLSSHAHSGYRAFVEQNERAFTTRLAKERGR